MKFRIRECRERKNMSQEELSKKAGVSRAVISGLETGELENTTAVTMKKIADALGMKVTEIFFEKEV